MISHISSDWRLLINNNRERRMTMTHTPGPWHWDSDPVKGDPLGRVRYRVVACGKTITQVYYSSFEGGATNAEADARLIAAAPELLASLQWALRFIEIYAAKSAGPATPEINKVKAAIAKATGAA